MDSPAAALLKRARDCADALVGQSLKYINLTYPQYVVLAVVARHRTTNLQMVMLHTGCQQRQCEHVIRRLVEKGLLERIRTAQHQRDYMLSCTDRGHEVMAIADDLIAEVDAALMDAIEPLSRDRFVAILNGFVTRFKH